MHFWKAHAYGNDFLYVLKADAAQAAPDQLARDMCDRHMGIGADGLIVYEPTSQGAGMRLFNADGGVAEISGNGVRALAALLLRDDLRPRAELTITTDGGLKRLTRVGREGSRQTFVAEMGSPTNLRPIAISVAGEAVQATVLSIGNPHCVIVGPLPDVDRFQRIGVALERHEMFPGGTNVEFVQAEGRETLRLFIWERGVGPTLSSGTGSCAALVAAASAGVVGRHAEVIAPGGSQLVEWRDDGVYLTGWAEVVCEGQWLRELPALPGR